jgi:NAD(P)-dependent dehydrogenase (short-subunit alcohol dehydrogenase family)
MRFAPDFAGKNVLVTGASRGIGRAIAVEFARAGADVAITARSTSAAPGKFPGTLDETAEAVRALGRRAIVIPADITSEEGARSIARTALAELGHIDVLVHNAGISAPQPFVETPLKRFDLVMNVNLRGPVILTQELLPSMMERGEGRIVNVNSYLPMTQDVPNQSIYSAAKMAFQNLVEWIARECAPSGIAANTLGIDREITTDGWKLHRPDIDQSGLEQPEAVAEAALWIAAQPLSYAGRLVTIARAREEMAAAG